NPNCMRPIITIQNEDVNQTLLPRFNPNIPGEFNEYCWLIVRIRKSLTSMRQGHFHHAGRLDIDPLHLPPLTDLAILTIGTVVEDEPIGHVVVIWNALEAVHLFVSFICTNAADRKPLSL